MNLFCGLDIPSDSYFRVFYCMSCGLSNEAWDVCMCEHTHKCTHHAVKA